MKVISFYDYLVYLIEPMYAIFEVMQFINLVFLISRKIKKSIDFEKANPFCQTSVIICLIICLLCFLYSIYFYATAFFQNKAVSQMFRIGIILVSICVSVIICITSTVTQNEDSNILNVSFVSLFFSYVTKTILNKKNIVEVKLIKELNYNSTISHFISKVYDLQKRVSQYITSFVMSGSTSYSIAGFFEFNKQENIIALVLGLVMCMTLSLTKHEWFADGSIDEAEVNEKNENPYQFIQWEERKHQAYYYGLNAVLVLMATNYTLKSLDYSNYTEAYDLSSLSSAIQLAIGTYYFIYKVNVSADE